jgi:XTP/dITP diphosphohydrolase
MNTLLIFASSNKHKAAEIEKMLPSDYYIQTMKDAGYTEDISEPYATLEENSKHKAETVFRTLGHNCFAEDTGLETEVLDGAPGVRSARYAGEPANDANNISKLLQELYGQLNRKAQFKTVLTLILKGETFQFTGICKGVIANSPSGEKGFGYDPVFIPEGEEKTFAEMTLDEKNLFSHRRKAVQQLIRFLQLRKAG